MSACRESSGNKPRRVLGFGCWFAAASFTTRPEATLQTQPSQLRRGWVCVI